MNEPAPQRRHAGRPPGSKNKPKEAQPTLAEMNMVQAQEPSTPQPQPVERPPMREEPRADPRGLTSRDLAEQRAQQIMNNDDGSTGTDEFYFDLRLIPDGWSYEWKRRTVAGSEDPAYQIQLAKAGWTPVPAKRHPELMPSTGHYEVIERKGQILMERPKVVTDRARMLASMNALNQVRMKEQQLSAAPPGQFERGTNPGAPVRVDKSYEPMPIPQK